MSRRIRIGIDGRALQPDFRAHFGRGIGRYVASLLPELAKDDRVELTALVDARLAPPVGIPEGVETAVVTRGGVADRVTGVSTHLRQHLAWPGFLRRLGLDGVHFCAQTDMPAAPRVASIVTVHDMIPHRMEESYRKGKSRVRFRLGRWLERRVLDRAEGILTVSETTADDLVKYFGVPRCRIRVTPNGISDSLAPADPESVQAFAERTGVPPEALLYLGGIDQRKNVPFLFEVVRELRDRGRPAPLVVAGSYEKDASHPALVERARELGVEGLVRWIGYVPDAELPALFGSAAAFVYPSLYEGFGLPPLEAMACGAPVVSSDRTSLPEVLGDAAILVDPTDVRAFADAVARVGDDPELAASLRRRGIERAARFRWSAAARATVDAYVELFASATRRS